MATMMVGSVIKLFLWWLTVIVPWNNAARQNTCGIFADDRCGIYDAPTLRSVMQNVTRDIGEVAEFSCIVQDSEHPSHTVSWTNIKENTVIAIDTEVLAHNFKYGVSQQTSQDEEDAVIHKLQIFNIAWLDQGPYQCVVDANGPSQVHFLNVRGSAVKPDPTDLPPANFTQCCVAQGVSSYCQALCSPSTLEIDAFQQEKCLTDLQKLVTCGSDGKNHADCCGQRFVPSFCLDYCRGTVPTDFNVTEQDLCLDRALDILACFSEGQHIIPGSPRYPMVEAMSSTYVHVSWSPPATDIDLVVGYKVFYQINGNTGYRSTHVIQSDESGSDSSALSTVLRHLQPATDYNVYVISVGHHGTSQPSAIVRTRTDPAIMLPPGTEHLDLIECCQEKQVSAECQGFLCGGTHVTLTAADRLGCYSHVDAVFTCLAGEKNHSNCCTLRGIEDKCLPLCTGSVLDIASSFEYLDCLERMPDVASCIQEGRVTLPNPPRDLRVSDVTGSMALVSWEENRSGLDQILAYVVEYRKATDPQYIRVETEATQYFLGSLAWGTEYEVRVSTKGTLGSSLPTSSLFFLTYLRDGGVGATTPVPGSVPAATPHNVTQCCHDSDVADDCLMMCDYDVNHEQDVSTSQFLGCHGDVGHVLKCGADGRNHQPCCRRRGVPDICLRYCSMTQQDAEQFSFNFAEVDCLDHVTEVVQCMQEGLGTIPGPPQGLHVVSNTQFTVSLAWSEPVRNPALVDAYYVRILDVDANTVSIGPRTTTKAYNVADLKPGEEYSFAVVAFNNNGESLPSDSVGVITPAANRSHPLNITVPTDLTDCCRENGMSEECVPICANSSVINLHDCAGHLGTVIKCASDKRDHTPCCREHRVSTHCLPFCTGQTDVYDFTSLLCVGYTEQFLACFREGYDYLPMMPVDFHLKETGSHHVIFAWEDPEKNVEGISYVLYYKEQGANSYRTSQPVTSPYRLDQLRPSAHYQAYLLAYNQYGSSLPTVEIGFWTNIEEIPVLKIIQIPDGILKENVPLVMLSCWTEGGQNASVYWKRLGNITRSSVYNITKVQRSDAGRYTCVATTVNGAQVASDAYVQVQYYPTASAVQPVVVVEEGQGQTAMLECQFTGFPEQITWFKDGRQLRPSEDSNKNKININRLIDQNMGIITSQLIINRVTVDDFGTYKCIGGNSAGQHMNLIQMIAPDSTTALTPAPPVRDIHKCCEDNGVTDECIIACSFDLDLTRILQELDNPADCVEQLPILTACSADGKDHSGCCAEKGIPEVCHVFCYGVVEELDNTHIQCLPHFEAIGDCMEEGHEKLPNPPHSVRGEIVEGYIHVFWEEPEVYPDRVTYYDVHYEAPAYGIVNVIRTAEKQSRALNIHGVQSFATYNIYVVSRNHWGTSQHSNEISVQTYEQFPGPPNGLSGRLSPSNPTQILLQWNQPETNPGSVTHYNVFYGTGGRYRLKNTTKLMYSLDNLSERTHYVIFVAALSSHYRSFNSNNISITTGGTKNKSEQKAGKSDKIGIGLGVSVVLLVLVCVGASAAYYFFRVRPAVNKHRRFQNPVQFENPGFNKSDIDEVPAMSASGISHGQHDYQISSQSADVKHPPDDDTSVMAEVADAHAQTYSDPIDVHLSNGVECPQPARAQYANPLYAKHATLDVSHSEVVDAGRVNLSFDTGDEKA